MYLAARFDSVKLMKWLFDHGADVRTARTPHQSYDKGSTPMFVACAEGHLKAVQFLHNHGAAADINAESELLETLLFIACQLSRTTCGYRKVVNPARHAFNKNDDTC